MNQCGNRNGTRKRVYIYKKKMHRFFGGLCREDLGDSMAFRGTTVDQDLIAESK